MTDQFMYDTAGPATNIRVSHPFAVAGYVDGLYQTFPELVTAFYPHAHIFSICVTADGNASCLDIEKGDAIPAQAPGWVKRQLAQGHYRPCLYANFYTMGAVEEAMRGSGIPRDRYRLWVADWTGVPHIPKGFDACQFQSNALFDTSVVSSDFFPSKSKSKSVTTPRSRRPHPKVVGSSAGAALSAGIIAVLHAAHVHITPTEASAITTIAAAVSGTISPGGSK